MHQTSEQSMPKRPATIGVERRSARAFTRVELVVILAVIAFTIRLVLPGTLSMREAARRDVCKDNLRKLGLAMRESGGRKVDNRPIAMEVSRPEPAGTSDVRLFVEAVIVLVFAGGVAAAALAIRFAVRHFNREDEPFLDRESRPARFTPKPAADSIWIE
jgi:hypothetical protein